MPSPDLSRRTAPMKPLFGQILPRGLRCVSALPKIYFAGHVLHRYGVSKFIWLWQTGVSSVVGVRGARRATSSDGVVVDSVVQGGGTAVWPYLVQRSKNTSVA